MKKFLSMVLALVMTMSLVTISAGAKDFTDGGKITYKEAVDVISELGIVDGYTDGAFNPQNTLTRGAAAKIICNLVLGPTTASALTADAAPFKDVPANHEFAGYIAYCAQKGIINGYADGTFRPAGTLNGYAFMKMLLGALGYDGSKEGFTGANWTINVAKQALGIDLDAGKEDFAGNEAVTREEACLYAFNTLQATMVEYENKSSIVIGDITVNTSSEYKDKEFSGVGAGNDGNIDRDGKVQFAEQYFSDLKKVGSDSDEFERPATTWKVKSTAVGTYANTPDATYTAEVEMGDIYKDLGLSSNLKVADVDVYMDGAKATSYGITKGDSSKKIGGNGILTEVFYDDDNDTATITSINTYFGEITSTHKASGNKDAYVTVAAKADAYGVGGNFETEEAFEIDDLVLYTYSNKTGDKGVQSIVSAEKIDGTLSAYTTGKSVTVGGTVYKANEAYKADVGNYGNAVDQDITVYLDAYGYVVYVDTEAATSNYAVVLGKETLTLSHPVKLLFADGTTKTVNLDITQSEFTALGAGNIVSYTTKSNGEYKLKVLANKTNTTTNGDVVVSKGTSAIEVNNVANMAANLTSDTNAVTATYANGKTIFLVATGTTGNETYNAYTGIANVPTINATGALPHVTAYVKSPSTTSYAGAATVIYIDATSNANIVGGSKDAIFVKGNGTGLTHDGNDSYFVYTAIVNGEVRDLKVDENINRGNGIDQLSLFGSITWDGDIATLSNGVNINTIPSNDPTGDVHVVKGTDKVKNDVVGLGGAYYTYASDCKVFRLDKDKNLDETAYSIGSVTKDSNDIVLFKMNNGDVTYIFIYEQEEITDVYSTVFAGATFYGNDGTFTNTATSAKAGTTVYVDFGAGVTATSALADFTVVNASLGRYSFTMPSRNITGSDFTTSTNYSMMVSNPVVTDFAKVTATVTNLGSSAWQATDTLTVEIAATINGVDTVVGTASAALGATVASGSTKDVEVTLSNLALDQVNGFSAKATINGAATATASSSRVALFVPSVVAAPAVTGTTAADVANVTVGTPIFDNGVIKVTVSYADASYTDAKITVTATNGTAVPNEITLTDDVGQATDTEVVITPDNAGKVTFTVATA